MADLIDREKLLEAYCIEIYETGYRGEGHDDEVIRIINRQDRETQPAAWTETNHDDVLSAIDMLNSYRNQDEISYNAYSELADAIYELETAQPTARERTIGNWRIGRDNDGNDYRLCPFCGKRASGYLNFCSYCGADMRGACDA